MRTEILKPTAENLEIAALALQRGELVAFPTETVYGLGASAFIDSAVRAVFSTKGRPADHPLILHLPADPDLAEFTAAGARQLSRARKLAERFWPGPLTLILPRGSRVSGLVTGGQDTVALRVPAHPVALELLRLAGAPLVAPSANRFGRISPTTARHVADELGGQLRFVLDGGPSSVGVESTIVDLSTDTPRILRPGMLQATELADVLGEAVYSAAVSSSPRVSGSLQSHYAPGTPARIASLQELTESVPAGDGVTGVIATASAPPGFSGEWRTLPADPAGYARRLYATLRELDGLADVILVQETAPGPEWDAVRDRLRRATHKQAPQGT